MITLNLGQVTIRATGNHPFYVLAGDGLAARPLPRDVSKEEMKPAEDGRWVEARDLRLGDVLMGKSGPGLLITGLSSRVEDMEVYNLEVRGCHNYAVHQMGILVHNKGGAEKSAQLESVKLYGQVTLEHYEASIVGAADASALLRWFQKNGYRVRPAAREILDYCVSQSWAFFAVKLNPGEKRHYENEFLPPLTIKYRYRQLVFPLRISSVSTSQTIKITLYVIAESTVPSLNFPTKPLSYDKNLLSESGSENYIETCIRESAGRGGPWAGRNMVRGTPAAHYQEAAITELMSNPFPENRNRYLTRLEARMGPAALTHDISLKLDRRPKAFKVDSGPGTTQQDAIIVLTLLVILALPSAAASFALGLLGTLLAGPYRLIRLLVRRFHQPMDGR